MINLVLSEWISFTGYLKEWIKNIKARKKFIFFYKEKVRKRARNLLRLFE